MDRGRSRGHAWMTWAITVAADRWSLTVPMPVPVPVPIPVIVEVAAPVDVEAAHRQRWRHYLGFRFGGNNDGNGISFAKPISLSRQNSCPIR